MESFIVNINHTAPGVSWVSHLICQLSLCYFFFMFVHLVRDVEQPALSYELKVNAYLMLKWSKLC